MKSPATVLPGWRKAYRIVSSAFPPISVFEDVLDPADLEMAFAIEGLTNDRLLEEAGVLARVPPADRLSGPGSSPVMAAFTHIGLPSRFSDGSYGVYYCADSLETAIAETRHHREYFLAATAEPSLELTLRSYVGSIQQPLHDLRHDYPELHDPDMASYPRPQAFAARLRERESWGLLYNSVRAPGHECAAVLRPPALTIPVPGPHLRYFWNGGLKRITHVLKLTAVRGFEQDRSS